MTKEKLFKELKSVMSDVFNLETNEINLTNEQVDIGEWDSLGHLRLFLSIEQRFNIQFTMDEISKINNVKTIVDIIFEKLNNAMERKNHEPI